MAKKKLTQLAAMAMLFTLPTEGYEGETIKHIVTAQDLEKYPELTEKGIKEGDEIEVIPAEDKTSGNASEAKKIADKLSVDEVFENSNGEFFTSENLALLSEKGVKDNVIKHSF